MYAVFSKEKTQLAPGIVVRMPGTWQDYHLLRENRSDSSIPRINSLLSLSSGLKIFGKIESSLDDLSY